MAGKKIIKIFKGLGRSRRDVYREVSPEVRDYLIQKDLAVDAIKKDVPVIDLQKKGPTGTRKVNTLSNTAARRMVKNIQADEPPISAKLLTTPKTTSPQPTTAEQFTIKSRESFEKDKANEILRLQKQRDNIGKKLSKLGQGNNTVAFNKGVAELKLINEKLNRVVNATSKSRLDAEKQTPLADRKEMEEPERGSVINVGSTRDAVTTGSYGKPELRTDTEKGFSRTVLSPLVGKKPRELSKDTRKIATIVETANKQFKVSSIKDKQRLAKLVEDYLNKGGSITKLEDGVARAASTGPDPSLAQLQALLGVDAPTKGALVGKVGQGQGKISLNPDRIPTTGRMDNLLEIDELMLNKPMIKETKKSSSKKTTRPYKPKKPEVRAGKPRKINGKTVETTQYRKKGGQIKRQKRRVSLRGHGVALRGY
tara:strand:+ start:532 stop:1806 length:1275 start_codon:yes stop_codon:yes gene_type:complete